MEVLVWLQTTPPALWILEGLWSYPIVLSSHAVGMAIVVGTVLMIDLRVLGFASAIPMPAFERMFVIAWIGVTLNVASGILLFIADGPRFVLNRAFQFKIGLIVAGAVSVWLLLAAVLDSTGQPRAITNRTKLVAVLSMVFWIGAVAAGRLVAYIY